MQVIKSFHFVNCPPRVRPICGNSLLDCANNAVCQAALLAPCLFANKSEVKHLFVRILDELLVHCVITASRPAVSQATSHSDHVC